MKEIIIKKIVRDQHVNLEDEKIKWLIYNLSKKYSVEAIKQTLKRVSEKIK